MNFFLRNSEAKKIRKSLSGNNVPLDEEVFCSALSNGRANGFDKLNEDELKVLKRMLDNLNHKQYLVGIYCIAFDLRVVDSKEITDLNDEKIVDYLREMNVLNSGGWFKLKNPKGDLIQIKAPFKNQSYYAVSLISWLLGQVYLTRSSQLN